jgi:hypothetical protein
LLVAVTPRRKLFKVKPFFENMKQTKSAGGVVINKDKVLVVNQNGNSWSLPKGHIDYGENHLELVKELDNYQRYKISLNGGDDKSELKTIFMFLFKTGQEVLKPIDPKNPEAKWIEKDKVADLLTHRKDKEFFLSVIDKV